jgi:hypothetical protein
MRVPRARRIGWGLLFGLLLACGPPPPPPPQPEPVPEPEPEPPPPPPPKCEALKEDCKADKDTSIPVPGTEYMFTPAKGWNYAKLEEASVAQVGEKGAVLVLTSFEPEKGFKAQSQRNEQAKSFAELVLIEPKGDKVALFQPNMQREIAGLKMKLWEVSGATRSEETGAMLIISATVEGRTLFGVGFAAKDDKDGTTSILAMLETLASGAGGGEDEGDEKDEGDGK